MTTPTGRTRTCYACGDQHAEHHMRPFGHTCFGEPRTWVCNTCSTLAPVTAPDAQPLLALAASR